MMFDYLFRTRAAKDGRYRPLPESAVQSRNTAKNLSHDQSFGGVESAADRFRRFDRFDRCVHCSVEFSALPELLSQVIASRRIVHDELLDLRRWRKRLRLTRRAYGKSARLRPITPGRRVFGKLRRVRRANRTSTALIHLLAIAKVI